mmetsp:Transcript_23913/g.31032  ORF Transcript_23913/g.31032 Transcript_23913/m.31032 type:complete len:234 (+) Transcript_23913:1779-2480(+)
MPDRESSMSLLDVCCCFIAQSKILASTTTSLSSLDFSCSRFTLSFTPPAIEASTQSLNLGSCLVFLFQLSPGGITTVNALHFVGCIPLFFHILAIQMTAISMLNCTNGLQYREILFLNIFTTPKCLYLCCCSIPFLNHLSNSMPSVSFLNSCSAMPSFYKIPSIMIPSIKTLDVNSCHTLGFIHFPAMMTAKEILYYFDCIQTSHILGPGLMTTATSLYFQYGIALTEEFLLP